MHLLTAATLKGEDIFTASEDAEIKLIVRMHKLAPVGIEVRVRLVQPAGDEIRVLRAISFKVSEDDEDAEDSMDDEDTCNIVQPRGELWAPWLQSPEAQERAQRRVDHEGASKARECAELAASVHRWREWPTKAWRQTAPMTALTALWDNHHPEQPMMLQMESELGCAARMWGTLHAQTTHTQEGKANIHQMLLVEPGIVVDTNPLVFSKIVTPEGQSWWEL